MIHYIGMDCHRKMAHACHLDASGRVVKAIDVAVTETGLREYAAAHLTTEDKVAIEASFYARQIAHVLTPFVAEVVVSNPLQTKVICQTRKKTDKVDARALADLLRLDYLPRIWLPDTSAQARRDLCARRCALIRDRTRIRNRVHAVLAAALVPVPLANVFTVAGMAWLRELKLTEYRRATIDSELRLHEAIEGEVGRVDEMMAKNGWEDERVKLLITLPGVSINVAETLLAAIGNVDRFETPDKLAGYLGLVPSIHQSGEKCYRGHITHHGNKAARTMLVQAAQNVADNPGPIGVAFRRLLKRKNWNVAVCACARKLVVIAWHMLKHGEPYRYARPESVDTKLSKLRTAATHQRRKPGPSKSAAPRHDLPEGVRTRTIPSLAKVYEREGIPPALSPKQLPAAERRMLKDAGVTAHVKSIQKERIVMVSTSKKPEATSSNQGADVAASPTI